MKTAIFEKFELIKACVPEIVKGKIIKDVNVGGVKLTYKVSMVKLLILDLFKHRIRITLKKYKYADPELSKRTYLRPYKTFLDTSKGKWAKCLWGSNAEPLTNLWIELELDYNSLQDGFALLKQEIRNTNITKHLLKASKLFYVPITQKKNQV